jgi:hypothetical protein
MLSKATIVTTREEALRACRDVDFPDFEILDGLVHIVGELAPENLPLAGSSIWEPWIERSCELINYLVGMAQCRIG